TATHATATASTAATCALRRSGGLPHRIALRWRAGGDEAVPLDLRGLEGLHLLDVVLQALGERLGRLGQPGEGLVQVAQRLVDRLQLGLEVLEPRDVELQRGRHVAGGPSAA